MRRQTLKSIQRQIENLTLKAEKLKKREKKPAIKEIMRLMQAHDISADELGSGKRRGRPRRNGVDPRKGKKAPVMYRNSKTGETWSGRGRAARWIVAAEKAGHKRNEYLVKKD